MAFDFRLLPGRCVRRNRARDPRAEGHVVLAGYTSASSIAVTLRLTNTPEAEAIGLVLRTAAGYVAAPRRAGNPGSSRYDRVTILATRTAPGGIRAPVQVPARNAAADAMGPGAAASPGLLPMEDLQRLLDATSGRPASPPPRPAGRDIPVLTTPFPGVGAVGDPP